jgi:hypothetical protein
MVIALIHWRIKPDETSIADFLKFWREQATVSDRAGLVGEFLSEAAKLTDYPYITWHLDHDHLGNFKSYVNVGIWTDETAFHEQIAKNFNDDKPMLPFEAFRRRRVIIKPDSWRIGKAALPNADHPANVK